MTSNDDVGNLVIFGVSPTEIDLVIRSETLGSNSVCRNATNTSYECKTTVCTRFPDRLMLAEKKHDGGHTKKS